MLQCTSKGHVTGEQTLAPSQKSGIKSIHGRLNALIVLRIEEYGRIKTFQNRLYDQIPVELELDRSESDDRILVDFNLPEPIEYPTIQETVIGKHRRVDFLIEYVLTVGIVAPESIGSVENWSDEDDSITVSDARKLGFVLPRSSKQSRLVSGFATATLKGQGGCCIPEEEPIVISMRSVGATAGPIQVDLHIENSTSRPVVGSLTMHKRAVVTFSPSSFADYTVCQAISAHALLIAPQSILSQPHSFPLSDHPVCQYAGEKSPRVMLVESDDYQDYDVDTFTFHSDYLLTCTLEGFEDECRMVVPCVQSNAP